MNKDLTDRNNDIEILRVFDYGYFSGCIAEADVKWIGGEYG